MKKIIYITDYIEGTPKIASVRYEEIIKLLGENYDILVVYDKNINNNKSEIIKNYMTFKSSRKKTISTSKFRNSDSRKILFINKFKNFIKQTSIYKSMNSKKFDEDNIYNNNREFFKNIINYIRENEIKDIFVTIPSINGLYIAKKLKEEFPNIRVVMEVRDIINNNIDNSVNKSILIKAEKCIGKISDIIICLSDGIYNHYNKMFPNIPCEIIKNGFSEEIFSECSYSRINNKEKVIFSHIGSIYGGRNIKDFLIGVSKFAQKNMKICEVNLIGNMDSLAITDIEKAKKIIDSSKVKINDLGIVNHEKAVEYLKNTDISVILTHKYGSDYAIPGKVFEHIGACKPTLAITKDSTLIRLIHGKYGQCVNHNPDEISEGINTLVNAEYSFEDRLNFSRKHQVDMISDIIGR